MNMQAMVEEFMRKHGQLVPDGLDSYGGYYINLRHGLIEEELREYWEATQVADPLATYDALCDLLYVVLGGFVHHGMNAEAGFAEVHRSNMTKDGGKATGGKVVKGPGYSPPDLAPLLSGGFGSTGAK